MKLELIVFIITGFMIYNTYHDGAYTKILKTYTKYYKMIMIAFVGFSIYLVMKKDPNSSRDFVKCAGNLVKYMPIDKSLTPFFDITEKSMSGGSNNINTGNHQLKRVINSGINTNNKRSVSETKKKYVASQQSWKCKHCGDMLDATFEVDHIVDLQFGGSNHVDNLVALCRNCHGKKTMQNHLNK